MTVVSPENTQEALIIQEKVDTNTPQQNIDTTQQQEEDPNWRSFREARKRDKEERQAAERRAAEKEAEANALKAAMEAAFQRGSNNISQSQTYSEGYNQEETEDERIERKVQAAIAIRETAAAKERHEREKQELPQRLLSAYPDYNNVVNEENGAYLEYHHPELYRAMLRQPENFDTCSDIYKLVKKFVPNSTTAKRESAKADSNFAKPKSISSTGITPSGEAQGSHIITKEKREANWVRMQKSLKGLSS